MLGSLLCANYYISTKENPKEKKGSLHSDFTDTPSDTDIQNRNRAIIASLAQSETPIKAAKSCNVGVLMTLFDEESRLAVEALIEGNINRLKRDAKALMS